MYFLLSPAKSLNETTEIPLNLAQIYSQPQLIEQSCQLMAVLKSKEPIDIMNLMKVSDNIAQLNVQRNQAWAWNQSTPFTTATAKASIYLFDGGVYTGIDAYSMDESTMYYMNKHVGILSGLYGLLRPLDLILPYRLEMGTKLANEAGDDLYQFWDKAITNLLIQRIQKDAPTDSQIVVNLASNEYFKAIKKSLLTKQGIKIITPRFEDEKGGKFKVISFYAKKARGLMINYASEQKVTDVEQLKQFNLGGYYYCKQASDEDTWTFRRDESIRVCACS